jgi:hypothetical protein
VISSSLTRRSWLDGDPENNGGSGGGYNSAPTFSALQAAGQARPPGPLPTPTVGAAPVPTAQNGGGILRAPTTVAPEPGIPASGIEIDGGPRPPLAGALPTIPGPTDIGGMTPSGVPPIITSAPPLPGGPSASGAPTGESDFEKQLRERYQSSPTAPQFTGPMAQTAADFTPANPFGPTSAAGGAAPAAGTPATSGAPPQLNSSILQSVLGMLQNPSGFTSDAATSTYNRLGGAIDDQFNVDNQKIDEEMARRGIPVSTIAGGRLFDSNVARKSAKEDLAGQILTNQASTIGSDQARAVAAAQGVSTDDFNKALETFNANQGANAQTFGQTEQKLQDYLGFGQQSFNNQLAGQNANNSQQQQLLALLMQMFGSTGGGVA